MKKDNRSRSRADKAAAQKGYKSRVIDCPKQYSIVANNLDKMLYNNDIEGNVWYRGTSAECQFYLNDVMVHCYTCPDNRAALIVDVWGGSAVEVKFTNDASWGDSVISFAKAETLRVIGKRSMTRMDKIKAFFKR